MDQQFHLISTKNTIHKTQFAINTNCYLSTLCILESEHSNISQVAVRAIDTWSGVLDL